MTRKLRSLIAFNPGNRPDLLSDGQIEALAGMTDLLRRAPVLDWRDPAIQPLLHRTEILVTGWGAPKIDAVLLDAMPKLGLIAHLAGSVKAMLDPAIWRRGIAVVNAVAGNAVPVAEFTLAAILFANKQVFRLNRVYRERRAMAKPWSKLAPGLGNYRKVVGIIGASRVGRRVIALLRPFDFTVLLADPYVAAEDARQLGVEPVPLDELLARSDVVSLHAPSTPATRTLIDRRHLALMRDGTVFINTARGALVDQDALIEATRSGRLDAIIDVTEPDELPPDSPLYDIPNVFLTPHIAGAQGRETERMVELVFAEIERYLRGNALQHRVEAVDLERLA
ncbi:MAG: hydroxyacid dehydrogenase [Proteobacteria bacterium]|nr:hydroxyacid dehydrogenase [Pseudomonadota bacterium]MBI3498180.1 hydroxyacid dehydrogenase [Pseudomonadota bacterium]